MEQSEKTLAIRLDDGRTVIARPRPEDQDFLAQSGGEARISLGSYELDVQGHGSSSDLSVDVEGHAMVLRLPTPADAAAVRKALMVGAMTVTVVAAGAIASMQGSPASTTSGQNIAVPPPPAAVSRHDFQVRRGEAIDKMLEAPGPVIQPADPTYERLDRIVPTAGAGSAGSATNVSRPDAQSPQSFEERREQASDKMLEAPEPLAQPSDITD